MSENQRKAIIKKTPNEVASSDEVYYLVYKAKNNSGMLPQTGVDNGLYYFIGGAGLLVLAIGVSRDKKKFVSSLMAVSVLGSVMSHPTQVLADTMNLSSYASYESKVNLSAGENLSKAVIDIPGYTYYGYFKGSKTIKIENKKVDKVNQDNKDKNKVDENKDNIKEGNKDIGNDSKTPDKNQNPKDDNNVTTDKKIHVPSRPRVNTQSRVVPKKPRVTKVSQNPPVVDQPSAEVPKAVVPSNPPVVDQPSAEVSKAVVPSNPPVVEQPSAEVPKAVVPSEAPVVELPDAVIPKAVVPSDYPIVELPEGEVNLKVVPSEAPEVVLPDEEIPKAIVPSEEPVVELPDAEIPKGMVSPEPPIIDPEYGEEIIDEKETKIELKNVKDAFLYRIDDKNNFVNTLYLENENIENSKFKVKVFSEDANKYIWLDVDSVSDNGDNFSVIASFPKTSELDENKIGGRYEVKIAKKPIETTSEILNFLDLVERINKMPGGDFVISNNLTASEIALENDATSYIAAPFTGTLKSKDGKVYSILDLKKPLFNSLNSATISNVNLADVDIKSTELEAVGSLANKTEESIISNVTASGSVIGNNNVGGIVGILGSNSEISNSSFNGSVSSIKSAGGLVSNVTQGSKVMNSYADISIFAKPGDSDRIGGLVGEVNSNGSIENSYVKGVINNYGEKRANVGGIYTGNTDSGIISNVVSFTNVINGKDFIGNINDLNKSEKEMRNNFLVEGDSQGTHVQNAAIAKISKNDAESKVSDFYAEKEKEAINLNNNKADYTNIKDYNESHKKAYENMSKLLPFYNKSTIVREANKISADNKLNTSDVRGIILLNGDKIVRNLYEEKNAADKIMIIYTDGSKETLSISGAQEYENTGIVDYNVDELNIKFHPNELAKDNRSWVNESISGIEGTSFRPQIFNQHLLRGWIPKEKEKAIYKLYIEDVFNDVKNNVNETVLGLVNHTDIADFTDPIIKNSLSKKLSDNKDALLVGLSYLNRWYDFANLNDNLIYAMDSYGSKRDSLDLVLGLGNASITALSAKDTEKTYSQLVSNYTNIGDVMKLIEDVYNKTNSGEDLNSWIKNTTKAFVIEKESKEENTKNDNLLQRLSKQEYQNTVLPFMNIKDENVYAIVTSNSTLFGIFDRYLDGLEKGQYGYDEKVAKIKNDLNSAATQTQSYYDFWYRILNERSRGRFVNTVAKVYDTYSTRDRSGKKVGRWSDEYGPYAFKSIKSFIGPIGKWEERREDAVAYAGVENDTPEFNYAQGDYITGLSTLTHEHTHNFDKTIFFDDYQRRAGQGPESFAMGLFQSPNPGNVEFGLNLIFDVAESDHYLLTHNKSPERFKTREDLQQYMKGVFDVIYTLELAEAKALSWKGYNFITNNYKIIKPRIHEVGVNYEGPISYEEEVVPANFVEGNLSDYKGLIDSNIVSGAIQSKIYGNDSYIEVSMFDSQYGILENNLGSSGGMTFRRVAFELLAEKGYYEGMIPYVSSKAYYTADDKSKVTGVNNLHSDTHILKTIFGDKYASFKDFRKDMFKRRDENKYNLKPITYWEPGKGSKQVYNAGFDTIVNAMYNTLSDPRNRNNPLQSLSNLKRNIFQAYLSSSDEFRKSIYK